MTDLEPTQDFQQAQENVNTIFAIFAHHRRRYALRGLRMHGGPMKLAELADEVAIRENEAPVSEISTRELKRVYTSLRDTHVPELERANLVRYDRERDVVELTAAVEHVEQYRELLDVDRGGTNCRSVDGSRESPRVR